MTDIELAAKAIHEADALLISAGAGMGVDSGLPDFRGTEGFWRAYPVVAKLGLSFPQLANPDWFTRSPRLAWAFYGHRLNLYRATVPHRGFARLLEWARGKRNGYFVYTSNVDGHFQRSGFELDRVFECHGSVHHFQCAKPCREVIWDATHERVTVDESQFLAEEPLPGCPHCGGLARPNILMFGDGQWVSDRAEVQAMRYQEWLHGLRSAKARLAVIEMGAGTAVPTVRWASETAAYQNQGQLIRINPREAEVPDGQIGLSLGALAAIDQITEVLNG